MRALVIAVLIIVVVAAAVAPDRGSALAEFCSRFVRKGWKLVVVEACMLFSVVLLVAHDLFRGHPLSLVKCK